MIEEEAVVAAVDEHRIWVDTVRQTACGRCAARAGCGQSLMARVLGENAQRARTRLILPRPERLSELQAGDRVMIGIPEAALLRGAFSLYMLPMLALVVGAIAGHAMTGQDLIAFLSGTLAFVCSLLWVRSCQQRQSLDPSWQPRVLHRLSGVTGTASVRAEAVKVL